MRPVRLVARAFVYGTEDEARVMSALLDVLGRAPDPESKGRLTRSRIKGHYGTDILLLEGVLKSPKELRGCFDRLGTAPDVVRTVRDEFAARLDEDNVLHFRLDKQEAVQGRLTLGSGGDALTVEVKYAQVGGDRTPEGFPFA